MLDFVISLLCIGFFLFFVISASIEEVTLWHTHNSRRGCARPVPSCCCSYVGVLQATYLSSLDAIFLVLRFLVQLLRLSLLIYHTRQTTKILTQDEIDFNAVNLEAVIGDDDQDRLSLPGVHGDSSSGITTSYIHLKPSIYLELQTVRAFDEDKNSGHDKRGKEKDDGDDVSSSSQSNGNKRREERRRSVTKEEVDLFASSPSDVRIGDDTPSSTRSSSTATHHQTLQQHGHELDDSYSSTLTDDEIRGLMD